MNSVAARDSAVSGNKTESEAAGTRVVRRIMGNQAMFSEVLMKSAVTVGFVIVQLNKRPVRRLDRVEVTFQGGQCLAM